MKAQSIKGPLKTSHSKDINQDSKNEKKGQEERIIWWRQRLFNLPEHFEIILKQEIVTQIIRLNIGSSMRVFLYVTLTLGVLVNMSPQDTHYILSFGKDHLTQEYQTKNIKPMRRRLSYT